jgi:hypothetical protein
MATPTARGRGCSYGALAVVARRIASSLPLVPPLASVTLAACDGESRASTAPLACLDGGAIEAECNFACQ